MTYDITVVIPTFNRINSLERALLSVLQQTVLAKKIIIGSDGDPICPTDFKIRYEGNGIRLMLRARKDHSALTMYENFYDAKTEYVANLYDDDWYEPEFIETMMNAWIHNPLRDDIAFYHCQSLIHFENGAALNINHEIPTGIMESKSFIDAVCNMPFTITPACCIFRRQDLLDNFHVGAFNGLPRSPGAVIGQECLAPLLIASKYKYVGYISKKLVNLGGGSSSTTIQQQNDPEFLRKYKRSKEIFQLLRYDKDQIELERVLEEKKKKMDELSKQSQKGHVCKCVQKKKNIK